MSGSQTLVDGAGQHVQAGVQNDLDDLCVVVAGGFQRAEIVVADRALRPNKLGGKADGGVGLRIVGGAVAVGGDLGVIEPNAVAGAEGVQRQAVLASAVPQRPRARYARTVCAPSAPPSSAVSKAR